MARLRICKPFGTKFIIKWIIRRFYFLALQPLPNLMCAVDNRAKGTVQELCRLLDLIGNSLHLSVSHSSSPNYTGAEPLWMMSLKMETTSSDRYRSEPELSTQRDKDGFNRGLIAGFRHEPIYNLAAPRGRDAGCHLP